MVLTAATYLDDDFNPRSPHGERPFPNSNQSEDLYYFNPRSPHGERHFQLVDMEKIMSGFQSTLSSRRATEQFLREAEYLKISIHALLTESDAGNQDAARRKCISIHALLTESDLPTGLQSGSIGKFQSTLSSRRATSQEFQDQNQTGISIHALLTESD